VLERLGFHVDIPSVPLCCGRPLYDWGWVEQAKGLWRRNLNALAADIAAGVPLIGLEPACVSAFRDELPALFPGDGAAKALSANTKMLSEFLAGEQLLPRAGGVVPDTALVQFHCHHHAVIGKEAECSVLAALPMRLEILEGGCCGMAGSFGFETAKYAVSKTIAEKAILAPLRAASPATAILADGFSCREQIEQQSGRSTLHLAELLERAL
jgi:Fe-S oxidoreductase